MHVYSAFCVRRKKPIRKQQKLDAQATLQRDASLMKN